MEVGMTVSYVNTQGEDQLALITRVYPTDPQDQHVFDLVINGDETPELFKEVYNEAEALPETHFWRDK